MSRYRDYDGDESRLPPGTQRVGYDADTQVYTYETSGGYRYEEESNRYGPLRSNASRPGEMTIEDAAEDIKSSNRYFLPFLCLVVVALVLFIAPPWGRSTNGDSILDCPIGFAKHNIEAGDTCFDIAKKFSTTVEEITEANANIDCDALHVGEQICVPSANLS